MNGLKTSKFYTAFKIGCFKKHRTIMHYVNVE